VLLSGQTIDANGRNCAELGETAPTPAATSLTAHCQTVLLHAAAPGKPSPGVSCNGCGVCCAAEPCPLSRVLLWHRRGSCPAIWNGHTAERIVRILMGDTETIRKLRHRKDGW